MSPSFPCPLEGQLNALERQQIDQAITTLLQENPVCLEVGTYKGGGSTLQILRTLAKGDGHLFGIEASPEIYEEMRVRLSAKEPELCRRFTPLCGFAQEVSPRLFSGGKATRIDFAFLDGGNNPREQMAEFHLLDPRMPVGSILMAHDAFLRKGKWLRRVLPLLDHFQTRFLPLSAEGLLVAKKCASHPSLKSRIKSGMVLFLCHLSLLEMAARWIPPRLRSMVFSLLPRKMGSWLGDGRSL